ncbi:MAG: hypothetical protein HQ503_07085 [Rhodospirillales bacterium]|nr:hypothetical protein [Rhodospirillales bacterium]
MELGSVGLNYLLANRASGYFPKRLVAPHLAGGALKIAPKTPVFHYPAHVVYSNDAHPDLLAPILKNLRKIVVDQNLNWPPPKLT